MLQCNVGYAGDGKMCYRDSDLDGIPDTELPCADRRCRKVNGGREGADRDRMTHAHTHTHAGTHLFQIGRVNKFNLTLKKIERAVRVLTFCKMMEHINILTKYRYANAKTNTNAHSIIY